MADWTDIPDASLDPEAPARSIDAKAFRDNPVAIAEGAPGAPKIDGAQGQVVERAAIFDLAVNRAKIQTALATTSGSIGGNANVNLTLNRGSFFPMIYVDSNGQVNAYLTGHSASTSGAGPRFGIRNTAATSVAYTMAHEYIVA